MSSRGFSLIETLIAMAIVSVALGALAQVFTITIQANHRAHTTTFAVILAQEKMEELRGLAWNVEPIASSDCLDGRGRSLGGCETTRPGTVYIRHWSRDPLTSNPANAVVLQVRVEDVKRLPENAFLVSVKARMAN